MSGGVSRFFFSITQEQNRFNILQLPRSFKDINLGNAAISAVYPDSGPQDI
jgi:hypothetical protein